MKKKKKKCCQLHKGESTVSHTSLTATSNLPMDQAKIQKAVALIRMESPREVVFFLSPSHSLE